MLERLVAFGRTLRDLGFDVGPGHAADAARALRAVDLADREQVFLALRCVFCQKPEDFGPFARAFRAFWDQGGVPPGPAALAAGGDGKSRAGPDGMVQARATAAGEGAEGAEQDGAQPGYTAQVLLRKDVGKLAPEELPELHHLARFLARRLALRLSRRLQRHRRGPIDPSRTFRRALRQGGEVLQLRRRRRRRDKARLVALLDVSGSMQPYGRFLLLFLSVLAARLPRTEVFVFSTGLTRVTREVKAGALDQAARAAPDWAGGTRIGVCLAEFAAAHGTLVDGRTALLVLSDGLDTGETDLLSLTMSRLKAAAGRVIWLNPLAGDPEYEPLARGMRAALPHVDLLAPAHSLESLLRLGRYLARPF